MIGAGSAPFVNWLVLLCQAEFRDVRLGQAVFSTLRELNAATDESPQRVLMTWALTTGGLAAAAVWLGRVAFARYDRVAGSRA